VSLASAWRVVAWCARRALDGREEEGEGQKRVGDGETALVLVLIKIVLEPTTTKKQSGKRDP
jgi:hypothetical protein